MISAAIPGKEEYINSEKFQICTYDWFQQNKLITLITRINQIRHQQPALQQTNNIKFCHIENENLIAFYKWDDHKTNEVLVIINLDDQNTQQGYVQLPLHELAIQESYKLQVSDLITGNRYSWHNEWNFVELQPSMPIHIFGINK